MNVSSLISSHRPPKLRQTSTPSGQSVQTTTSQSQKELLKAAGDSGLRFTFQSNLLDRLTDNLDEACLESPVPDEILTHWECLNLDHQRYHDNATVHNEIFLLHPVYDHQLFQIVHFLVTYNMDRLFRPENIPGAMERLSWKRYRHANAGVNTGSADAMLADESRRLFAIMEIKFPSSPASEDGDDLANCLSLVRRADSSSAFHLKYMMNDEDGFSMSPNVPPVMGQHLLQVSQTPTRVQRVIRS